MNKKLRLHRMTIAHLTTGALSGVIGGVTGPTEGVTIQSRQVDDKVEPCQSPRPEEDTWGIKTAP